MKKDNKRIETVPELLDAVSDKKLSLYAFVLLCLLCAVPYIAGFMNIVMPDKEDTFVILDTYYAHIWHPIIQIIGFLGLVIGMFSFGKSLLEEKRNGRSITRYILSHTALFLCAALFLWSVLSMLVSGNIYRCYIGNAYRKEGVLTYAAYLGYLCIGRALLREIAQKLYFAVFAFSALPIALAVIFQSETLRSFLNMNVDGGAVFFRNTNHSAYYLGLAIMTAAVLFMTSGKRLLPKLIYGSAFALLMYALIINGTLGTYLGVAGGLVLLALILLLNFTGIFGSKTKGERASEFVFSVILVAVFASVSLLSAIKSDKLTKDIEIFNLELHTVVVTPEEATESEGSGRLRLWKAALRYSFEKPIFGYGPDNLEERYKADGISIDRPHNVPLQIAASLGYPALAIYAAIFVCYLVSFIRQRKKLSLFDICLFCAVAEHFAQSLVGNSMFCTTPYFVVLLSIALHRLYMLKHDKMPSR